MKNNEVKVIKKMMKKQKKIKKEMKSISGSLDGDENILCEILSRLPVKSLVRFKCVCKHWQSLIQQDPYFIDLHLSRSKTRPSLLLDCRLEGQWCLLLADLLEERASIRTITNSFTDHNSSYVRGPVNGLICIYSRGSRFAVRICNLSIQEITPWIKIPTMEEEKEYATKYGVRVDQFFPTFEFGYDPLTKEHKVVCVFRIHRTIRRIDARRSVLRNVTVCKVLTVGHNEWRRIEAPPYGLHRSSSFYANGVIYWVKRQNGGCVRSEQTSKVIVAFDVGIEKFRVIQIPNIILDLPPNNLSGRKIGSFEVDGCVALFRRVSDYTVKLWIFDDDKKEQSSSSSRNDNWIEETISLPLPCKANWELYFKAVDGTDKIIVHYSSSFDKLVILYSYDRKMKTFKSIEISGMPSVDTTIYSCSPFTEGLFPVQ